MSIAEKVKQTVEASSPEITKQAEFVKLRDFYTEMQQAGVAQKQEYSLPPLDTIGRRLHQMMPARTRK